MTNYVSFYTIFDHLGNHLHMFCQRSLDGFLNQRTLIIKDGSPPSAFLPSTPDASLLSSTPPNGFGYRDPWRNQNQGPYDQFYTTFVNQQGPILPESVTTHPAVGDEFDPGQMNDRVSSDDGEERKEDVEASSEEQLAEKTYGPFQVFNYQGSSMMNSRLEHVDLDSHQDYIQSSGKPFVRKRK